MSNQVRVISRRSRRRHRTFQQALEALGVRYVEQPGYEGDDVIATLATMGEQAGYKTLVLSGDRDAFQLIDDHITVLYPGYHFKDLKHMDPQAVLDKYHVTPQQYPDLAALRGRGQSGSRRDWCRTMRWAAGCLRRPAYADAP